MKKMEGKRQKIKETEENREKEREYTNDKQKIKMGEIRKNYIKRRKNGKMGKQRKIELITGLKKEDEIEEKGISRKT